MTSALVGFLGVVVGLAVGFGYRFWATRREELMSATVATTLLRDSSSAAQRQDSNILAETWEKQRVALIRLIAPNDYKRLARMVEQTPPDVEVVDVLDHLTSLFWSEHQAFILTPLAKYVRRDALSAKAAAIIGRPQAPAT